jgi:hypothetical protein
VESIDCSSNRSRVRRPVCRVLGAEDPLRSMWETMSETSTNFKTSSRLAPRPK